MRKKRLRVCCLLVQTQKIVSALRTTTASWLARVYCKECHIIFIIFPSSVITGIRAAGNKAPQRRKHFILLPLGQ